MSSPPTIYDFIARNNRNTVFLVLMFPFALSVMIFLAMYVALYMFDMDGTLSMDGIQIAASLHLNPFTVTQDTSYGALVGIAAFGYMAIAVVPIFIITGLWMFIAYFCGAGMILSASTANPVRKSDSPEIYRLVENVAIAAGLPTPKLYVIQDESLNAFATGRDVNHASITLTTGLIKALNRQELEGVIAHEMAHIGNRDIRLMLMIIIGIGVLTFMSDILFRTLASGGRSRSSSNNNGAAAIYLVVIAVAIAITLFSFIVAPILRFAISRSQEYQADSTAAIITRNPGALASALTKIAQDSRVEALDNMPSVGALCIANPLGKHRKRLFDAISGLYATHPPIADRIAALRTMDSMG